MPRRAIILLLFLLNWKTTQGETIPQNPPIASPPPILPPDKYPPLHAPAIKLKTTVRLHMMNFASGVDKVAFSPDGKYLAILNNTGLVTGVIVIWDLSANRPISQISDPVIGVFGEHFATQLCWMPDSKTITLACSEKTDPKNHASPFVLRFWNALTGTLAQEIPGVLMGLGSRLNSDGTKFLSAGGDRQHPGYRIYDTRTWQFQDYPAFGISVNDAGEPFWTPEDNICIVNQWNNRSPEHVLDGLKQGDVLAQLYSPGSTRPLQNILLQPSIPTDPPSRFYRPNLSADYRSIDRVHHRIAVGFGNIKVLDSRTLQILYSYPPETGVIGPAAFGPAGGMAFSADGNYLFLMDQTGPSGRSLILDAATGKPVGSFPGGRSGFDVSQDGSLLAMGEGATVDIFTIGH